MVGIPRSKGCTTCRRRKVACDQQRPFCQRCINAKRHCEGYEQYPIFLHRTGDGLVPRARFEEAKTSLPPNIQSLTGESNEQHMVGWFCTSYAPHHGSWMLHAIELPSPPVALQKAMLALSVTRYGRLHANDDAVLRGQEFYGEALALLQKLLDDQERVWHDETLVCVRAVVLYELFESTSDNSAAWEHHLSGMTHLIELRGPNRHYNPMARSVLEDVRYALMLKALMLHKQSPFGQTQWHMGGLNAEQELYDLGFQLAELLEKADQGLHDRHARTDLHKSLRMLKSNVTQPAVLMNLLACELLLGFVTDPLESEETNEGMQLADSIMEMLPMVNESGGEEHRSIFPLTCTLWQYRDDEIKRAQAEAMMSQIAETSKVRFVGPNYQIEPLMPKMVGNK